MTSASGTFTSCGFGQPFSLQFSCTGTGCSYLNDFPSTTCTTDGATLSCTNGVVYPGSNYTTKFTVDQPLSVVSQSMQIFLTGECTEFDVTNNGTQSGVLVQSLPIDDCTPKASSTSLSSGSVQSGTTSTTVATTTSSALSSRSTLSTSISYSNASSSTSIGTSFSTSLGTSSSASVGTSSSNSVGTSSSISLGTSSASIGTSSTCSSTSHSPSSMFTSSSPLTSSSSPGSGTSSAVLSDSTTKATSVTMKTMVIVTSGITVTATEPCTQDSGATPTASVSLLSPCPTCVNSNSTVTNSGVPQAIFGSSPTESSSTPTTDTSVLGFAATGTTSGNVRSTISSNATTLTGAPQIGSTSSARSCRKRPHLSIYSLVLVLFAFLHLATALDISAPEELVHRAISPPVLPGGTTLAPSTGLVLRAEGSLGKKFTEILEDWLAGKITTPSLSETIVAEIYSAVCSHYAGAAITAGAFAEVGALLEYLSLVFDTIALPAGPEGWVIAFTFAIMVNVVVNELFPMISAMADQACDAAKEFVLCSTHFEDDAMNCGFCGNPCPSGRCKNSACVSNTCTGETCETFTACGPGGTCVCASTAEGTGFCVDGSTPCADLQTCRSSSNCPAGVVCAVASCCGVNVCVGATTCGGANVTSAAKFLFRKEVDGLTFGNLY